MSTISEQSFPGPAPPLGSVVLSYDPVPSLLPSVELLLQDEAALGSCSNVARELAEHSRNRQDGPVTRIAGELQFPDDGGNKRACETRGRHRVSFPKSSSICFHVNMSVRGGAIGALCVLSLLMGIPVLAGIYSVRDPTYSCIVDVLPAAGVSVDSSQPIIGTLTMVPIGLQCSFTSKDGEMVITKPDWFSSAMAGTSVVSLLGVCVLAIGFRQRRQLSD